MDALERQQEQQEAGQADQHQQLLYQQVAAEVDRAEQQQMQVDQPQQLMQAEQPQQQMQAELPLQDLLLQQQQDLLQQQQLQIQEQAAAGYQQLQQQQMEAYQQQQVWYQLDARGKIDQYDEDDWFVPEHVPFKRRQNVSSTMAASRPHPWKRVRHHIAAENYQELPVDTPTYVSLEAPLPMYPPKRYCDITGVAGCGFCSNVDSSLIVELQLLYASTALLEGTDSDA